MRITQSLHRARQQGPERIATVFGRRRRTVAETVDRVARLSGALREAGVGNGDRVGIYALNSDRYHELLFAIPWAGAVVNPVNTRWSTAEVGYSLTDCQTSVLFVDDAFASVADELRNLVPGLHTVIFCGDGDTPPGMISYETLVRDTAPAADAERGGDDLFGIFYTGGTTGQPKGVMLSHRACLTSAMGSLVSTDILSRGGTLLHAAPMYHLADIAAWNIGNLTGSTHVMVPSFTSAGVITAIADHRVTDALLVPTMIQMLVDAPELAAADLSSVQRIMYGASPIAESVLIRARQALPNARFTQAYGMTELAPIATLLTAEDHDDPSLTRSCGRAAAHAEVRIVSVGDNELPYGDVGEIAVRGDHVMTGYWNKPDETSRALRGGWMHTGDAGYMDARGFVFVVDRIKDMVITGGENVYSVEVENAIAKHPAVAQVAVVGVPDDQWGERVHAVVVTRPGHVVDLVELQDFCRVHIAGYKLPRSLELIDALPISGAGKVLKRELRRRHVTAGEQASPESART
ncbi:long-chain-fatty-acid--CoA ligase [Amycolatopsis pithecellobii]|uniref:Long-chain-fatty-acid--CoA ligase n=1 Tax=Amycolatopsis pithecellobii TaxID=664692 RepID=A0A6N7Z943_9PSEU|nr:long-chain-fatty-acid--CoA ligase [Amycolatopsis pithecellobii]MTD57996.1 long-chain-fatty-acid--CoA ligase [Amycolatopsis pithecellobii]